MLSLKKSLKTSGFYTECLWHENDNMTACGCKRHLQILTKEIGLKNPYCRTYAIVHE